LLDGVGDRAPNVISQVPSTPKGIFPHPGPVRSRRIKHDRSGGLTFNLPPGSASLSRSPDARHVCGMRLLMLLAYPPTPTDNTPRPCPMLGARCDYEFWPHASMKMPLQAYAWLARADDEHRPVVHQDLAWPGSPRALDPSSHRAGARPTARSASPRWTVLESLADWYPGRSSPAICARI
jgi:hypothetical protein